MHASDPPPRYTERPLPRRAFVPGRSARPAAPIWPDPIGPWSPDAWRTLEPWLHAVDLYNAEFWWEAHEVLEGLWHAAGRTGPAAGLMQGLIHVSAAHLNHRRGHSEAARRQAGRGARRLEAATTAGIRMGFDAADFARRVREAFDRAAPERVPLHLDAPPRV